MLGLLRSIWNGIRDIPYLVADFFVMIINGLVAAIGAAIHFFVSLLPSFPAAPGTPDSGALQWINYFVPLSGLLTLFVTFVSCWLGFLAIRIALRWVKAL